MPIVANAREFRLQSRGQYKQLYINNIGVKKYPSNKKLAENDFKTTQRRWKVRICTYKNTY